MSLVRCRECKKTISTEAGACPHCGCPKPAPPPGERPGAKSAAILITISVGITGILLLPMCSSKKPATPLAATAAPAAPVTTAAETKANEAALEPCRAKLKQAQKLDVLADLQWKGPRLHVVAGRTYYTMPFHAKEGFADTVNCFAMAGKSDCLSFDILHWSTGKPTDRYSNCKLKPL